MLPLVSRAAATIACLVCLAEGAIAIGGATSSGAAESGVPAPRGEACTGSSRRKGGSSGHEVPRTKRT
jgi:hypothetical protein